MGLLKAATDGVKSVGTNVANAHEQGKAIKEKRAAGELPGSAANDDSTLIGPLWDYKTIVLTGGFMGRHKEELDRAAFERHLDRLGARGFKLTWVLLEQALHGEKDGHVLIFKRPVSLVEEVEPATSDDA